MTLAAPAQAIRGKQAAAYAIASLLRFPELVEESGLSPSDFDDPTHRELVAAIATVPAEIRTPQGSIPLLEAAARAGLDVAAVQGISAHQVYSREQAQHWVREVRQASLVANIRAELQELIASRLDPEHPVDALLGRLGAVRERYVGALADDEVTTLEDLAQLHVSDEERAIEHGRPRVVCQSGLATLDRRCRWGRPGELTVMFAGGGTGKSTLALDIAKTNSRAGNHVAVFSGEMTGAQLGEKAIYAAGGRDQRDGTMSSVLDLYDALERLQASQEGRRIHVDLRPRTTPSQVLATVRKLAAKVDGPLPLVIFDHLRHLDVSAIVGRGANEYQLLSRASYEAKAIAKAAGVHVLLLTHTSRKSDGADAPTMAMIRGSGEIEENADIILAPWRPVNQPMRLYVLKCRNTGFGGDFELLYDAKAQTFREGA